MQDEDVHRQYRRPAEAKQEGLIVDPKAIDRGQSVKPVLDRLREKHRMRFKALSFT